MQLEVLLHSGAVLRLGTLIGGLSQSNFRIHSDVLPFSASEYSWSMGIGRALLVVIIPKTTL